MTNNWFNLTGTPELIEIGHVISTNYHPKRNINFFIFGIVISGHRTIQLGKDKLFLKAGDYFLLPPNVQHSGIRLDKHDVYFVHFRSDYKLVKNSPQITTSKILLPTSGKFPKSIHISNLFEYLNQTYSSKQISNNLIEMHFQSILSYISEYQQSLLKQSDKDLALSEKINNFILKKECGTLKAEDFEKEFRLSYKKLNNTFRKVYGRTIKQDFINQKITYASQLLLEGNSIIKVSEKVGYEDYFYFLKAFKRVKGMTPTEFINDHFSQ